MSFFSRKPRCLVDGCKKAQAKGDEGYCAAHLQQQQENDGGDGAGGDDGDDTIDLDDDGFSDDELLLSDDDDELGGGGSGRRKSKSMRPASSPTSRRQSGLDVPAGKRRHQRKVSRILQLKSFVGGKAVHSRLGRQAVLHYAGVSGSTLITCVQQCAAKFTNARDGKRVMTQTMKLALRAKLANDDQSIDAVDVWHLSQPVNELLLELHANFHATDNVDIDADGVSRQISDFYTLIHGSVLRMLNVTNKNAAKVKWLFDYVSNTGFLNAMLRREDMLAEKTRMCAALDTLVEPILESRRVAQTSVSQRCVYAGCRHPRVDTAYASAPRFRSLEYCGKHHLKTFLTLVHEPSVEHFLHTDKTYAPFLEAMTSHCRHRHLVPLRNGTYNYSRTPKRTRKVFAQAVMLKYFDSDNATHPVDLPAHLLTPLQAASAAINGSGDVDVDPSMFAAVEAYATAELTRVFNEHFVASPAFSAYVELLALPQEVSDQLGEERIEKLVSEQRRAEDGDGDGDGNGNGNGDGGGEGGAEDGDLDVIAESKRAEHDAEDDDGHDTI